MGGVVPKILIDAFFCGQGQLAIRVSSQAVFAKTGQRKNRRAGAFALSGNLQHLRCFAGIGNDHGKISLGQTTSLISLVVQIVGDDHPFSDLQHLFPEGLGLIDSSSGGKNVDFFVVFKKQHGFVQIFIPEKLHGVPDGFLVQLPDVLRYPHGTVGFRKGKIEVHLALPLVKIFQLAHKVLLEVVKAGKAQFFAKAHLKDDHKLWLKDGEPSLEEIKQAFLNAPMENVADIVICGFGEPTMRLDDLVKLLTFIHQTYPKFKVRMNTNGLSDLEYGKKTAVLFKGLLNTISISLNESNAEKYLEVTRSRFGIKSYKAMLDFAVDCKNYIPNVVVTIVDIIGEDEINACKKVCEEYNLNLRIRRYEAN